MITEVVRHGTRVHRGTGPWTPAVHAVLTHLTAVDFDAAPTVFGHDPEGREVLSWIDGTVAPDPDPEIWTLPVLQEVGALIRRLHDASEGFALPPGVRWAHAPEADMAGDHVICHNDLAPKNLVLRDGHPIAIIDWDLASPNPRIWDLAHVLWQFVPLGASPLPLAAQVARCRAVLNGYGWDTQAHGDEDIARVVALRMQRTVDGITSLAAEGIPAFITLRDRGVVDEIGDHRDWVLDHAAGINAGIATEHDH